MHSNKRVFVYQGRPTGGGSKQSLLNLILNLDKKIEFKIVCGCEGWFQNRLEEENIDYLLIKESDKLINNYYHTNHKIISIFKIFILGFNSMINNLRAMRREEIDIVILNETRDLFFVGLPAIILRKKIISFVRGKQNKFDKIRLILSDKIISLSSELIDKSPKKVKNKSKIIPNFIDLEVTDNLKRIEKNSKKVQIAFVGSIIPIKGFYHLTNIVKEIKDYNFVVNVYGDAPNNEQEYKKNIINLTKEFKIQDRITFHGWKQDVFSHIAQSDILIQTSESEGLPRVIMEAMSLSKPIIAFDVGGTRDLVKNNYNGYLIEYKDYENYAIALKKLIKSKLLRKTMGENSYKTIQENFSKDVVLRKIEKELNIIAK